jgi:hypothetical protein
MRVKIMNKVWGLELDRNEKLLRLACADHAGRDGGSIHPAVASIA